MGTAVKPVAGATGVDGIPALYVPAGIVTVTAGTAVGFPFPSKVMEEVPTLTAGKVVSAG